MNVILCLIMLAVVFTLAGIGSELNSMNKNLEYLNGIHNRILEMSEYIYDIKEKL